MDYYFDRITLELEKYQTDKDKVHLDKALAVLQKALQTITPSAQELVDTYINAAEINLQLENADKTVDCLNVV